MRFILAGILVLAVFIAGCGQQACPDTNDPVCGKDGVTYKNACLARAAGTEVKGPGACEEACKDSDGGKDIFSKGAVSARGTVQEDSCIDSSKVEEKFCEDGRPGTQTLPCPAGFQCDAGKCVELSCSDTDGGIEEDEKGTVTAGGRSLSDECAGPDSVKENYCEDGRPESKTVECGAGEQCAGGECVQRPCSDSDGGKDASVKGTVSKGSQSSTDSCADSDSVKEYFCAAGDVQTENVDCPSGFGCDEGRCVKNVCKDTDSGKDQFTKGTTSYGSASATDSCYSATTVLEYFCVSDTSYTNEKISCGSFSECVDGKCVTVECAKNETDYDDEDERHEIAAFDDSDELRLYSGNAVEINDGMFLLLDSVSGNESTFKLYLTFQDLLDDDDECSETIEEGDTANDLCGENTGDVEVNEVNDTDEYADINVDEYYATQYYTQTGMVTDWTEKTQCPDDEVEFDEYEADFYPYIDTQSSGLNLDGKKFVIFNGLAEIVEIDETTLTFEFDGDEYGLEDGDIFEYLNEEYDVTLVFNDAGLERFALEHT
jgi:hypothetical protein